MKNDLPKNPYSIEPEGADTGDGYSMSAAMMAIAYEQRTANLIAAATATLANGAAMFPEVSVDVREEILERLDAGPASE